MYLAVEFSGSSSNVPDWKRKTQNVVIGTFRIPANSSDDQVNVRTLTSGCFFLKSFHAVVESIKIHPIWLRIHCYHTD